MKKQSTYPSNYTEDLQKRMAKAGITNAEMARETGLNPSQLSRWFNTAMQPSLKNVNVLEAAFAKLARRK